MINKYRYQTVSKTTNFFMNCRIGRIGTRFRTFFDIFSIILTTFDNESHNYARIRHIAQSNKTHK